MISEAIEKMKATLAVKTAKEMDFKSEKAQWKFEVVKEDNPELAEFVENWAKLAQKQMEARAKLTGEEIEDEMSKSILAGTFKIVEFLLSAGVDYHTARAVLIAYWKYGDKMFSVYKSA